jgi:hypothetical protein
MQPRLVRCENRERAIVMVGKLTRRIDSLKQYDCFYCDGRNFVAWCVKYSNRDCSNVISIKCHGISLKHRLGTLVCFYIQNVGYWTVGAAMSIPLSILSGLDSSFVRSSLSWTPLPLQASTGPPIEDFVSGVLYYTEQSCFHRSLARLARRSITLSPTLLTLK